MNAKRSAILLSGLLLIMIGIAWAQPSNTAGPTCPAVADEYDQEMLIPTAWARADWNAKTSRWEIDCSQMDVMANIAGSYLANAANTGSNTMNARPARRTPAKRRPNE